MKNKIVFIILPIFLFFNACVNFPNNKNSWISYKAKIINKSEYNLFIQFCISDYGKLKAEREYLLSNTASSYLYYFGNITSKSPKDNIIKFTILDIDTHKVLKRINDMEDLFIFVSSEVDRDKSIWEYYDLIITNEYLNNQ